MLEKELLLNGCYKNNRIGAALEGRNPAMIIRMHSGFVFMMDQQFLPGWCILTAYPQVFELNSLEFNKRNEFLEDMQVLGEAVASAVKPLRMNYSILGNTDGYLHAHVYPRYDWEKPGLLKKPAWLYPEDYWKNSEYALNEKHFELALQIKNNIEKLSLKD